MKNDLKKKFLDILFEPEDPEEIVDEGPIKEVRQKVEPKPVETSQASRTQKASDVLYGSDNKETNKAFINYQEISKTTNINTAPKYHKEEKSLDLSDTYELKRHISPIFGETEDKSSKKEETVKKPVQQMPSMPKGDYQGVVLSPIFGYDNASADKARTNFVKNKNKDAAILREPTKVQQTKNVIVEELYDDEPISLFDEPFDVEDKKEKNDEPFTSEIKVIDVEGEPIEEVKEEYEEEPVKPFEVNNLDDLDMFSNSNKEDKDEGMSLNAKSFIDDILGDKE